MLLAEPAGEEAVAERLEDEVIGGSVVAGLDQDVVELGQERVLQLDAGLLLKRLIGFFLVDGTQCPISGGGEGGRVNTYSVRLLHLILVQYDLGLEK